MVKLPWIELARERIGEKEIKGEKHSSFIVNLWKLIKRGGIKDDETPWCAAFVGGMLESAGIPSSRFESARSYLGWGHKLDVPCYGCIGVMSRDGGGHVTFIVGKDSKGNLLGLGGNQGDAVSIAAFSPSRFTGFRWPKDYPLPDEYDLPVGTAAQIQSMT